MPGLRLFFVPFRSAKGRPFAERKGTNRERTTPQFGQSRQSVRAHARSIAIDYSVLYVSADIYQYPDRKGCMRHRRKDKAWSAAMVRSIWTLALVLATLEGSALAQETDPAAPDELPPVSAQLPSGMPSPVAAPATIPVVILNDPAPRIWARGDYLMWWTKRAGLPPLVVTGSENDPFPGALDQPGTRILFGDKGLGYGMYNGMRLSLGAWIDSDSHLGVEAGGFLLDHRTASFIAQGDANGQPFLATPFINANTGNQNVYFISQNFANPALSALLTGGVAVTSSTNLWSWE